MISAIRIPPCFPLPVTRRALRVSRFTLLVLLWAALIGARPIPARAGDRAGALENGRPALTEKPAGQSPETDPAERTAPLPPAAEILAQARANLPREELFIKGQILSGGRIGKLERAGYIEITLKFTEDSAKALYKISDAFGTTDEQMIISMNKGAAPLFAYRRGNPLQPAAAPAADKFIRDTDVTWNDLGLLFLWRTDGRTLRSENLRGRDCYVIEFPGQTDPAAANHESRIANSKVIWIDAQLLMLIQMEDIDRDGKLQRRMAVKNIKKISERWMIKNMEIRSYPSLHHTLIRIDELSSAVQNQPPAAN
ncbi:MAG: outer membrane lipoprotein-sorting protein [Kiritimatiellae bacterium]|nr:outer membrane lipoprotein-sorting protein [Kiritimatiellia bacterium]